MYNVGLPANLSKKKKNAAVLKVSYFHFASVFVGLVPLYGGEKYDCMFEHTFTFVLKDKHAFLTVRLTAHHS